MKRKNTTALLVTSALAGGAAHGAIVYTNFSNLTIVGRSGAGEFDVTPDLNSHFYLLYQDSNSQKPEIRGDGASTFVLSRTWQNTNNMDQGNRTYGGLPATKGGVLVDGQMLDVNPSKQQNGVTNLVVQPNGYLNARPSDTDGDSGGSATVDHIGDWGTTTTNSGYVGLAMVNAGVTNFGWAHIVWSDPSSDGADPNAQIILVDAAYETTPNKGILTGAGSATPPTFLTVPGSISTYLGASFLLPAQVDGATSYRWQAGAVGSGVFANLSDSATVAGSSTSALLIQGAGLGNTADYRLIASNSAGSVTSSPPVTVTIQTPGPTPTSAVGWYNAFQNQNDLTYTGSRQNVSYKASNGKNYWLINELIGGTADPSSHAFTDIPVHVDNKIMLESGNVRVPTDRAAISVASVPTGSSFYSLVDMFEANGYAYVLLQQLGAAFHFGAQGGELAKFQIDANGLLTPLGLTPTPATDVTDSTNLTAIQWADSAIVQNGYVYFFGENTDGAGTYLARVATASLENINAWTYWNGSAWDATETNAVPVITNSIGIVRVYQGAWVGINKVRGMNGTDTYAYVAAQPQGPYNAQFLFTDPVNADANGVGMTTNSVTGAEEPYYSVVPSAHPELAVDSGKLLVSIDYWDGSGATYTYNASDVGLFKPRFYEVSLALPAHIDIQRSGANVTLNWTGGLLLEAPSLTGPWITNSAASPLTISPTAPQKFYRVQAQ